MLITAIGFLKIYNSIMQKGHGVKLFGHPDLPRLEQALCLGTAGSGRPSCYWEFPLEGEPGLDILVLNRTQNKSLTIKERNYPYKKAFEVAAGSAVEDFCYGLEWDLSQQAQVAEAGFYIDHADNDSLMAVVLTELGVPERWAAVQQIFARLPAGWQRYYLGLFPQRDGSPVRLGLTVGAGILAGYREQPSRLAEVLRKIGYSSFTAEMLEEILHPVYGAFAWDLQFDVFADGTLGPDMGLSYYFHKGSNKVNLQDFQTDENQKLFRHLEDLGVADERWQQLPQCLFSRHSLCFSEGRLFKLILENRFNFLKVKWRNGKPLPAKFYFESQAVVL